MKKQQTLNSFFQNSNLTQTVSKYSSSMLLDRCQELVDRVSSTNSSNTKVEYLKEFDDIKNLVEMVYNPLKPFHVTSKTVKKNKKKKLKDNPEKYHDVLELLNALHDNEISGHKAIASVLYFIKCHSNHEDLIYNIIDKDLKIRMGSKQINKSFPNLIPDFSVALGEKIEKYPDAPNSGDWKISRKLDGVRCIAVFHKGIVEFYSRTGNQFTNLGKLEPILSKHFQNTFKGEGGCVLDGEVCIIDNQGKEHFSEIMKVIRKKDYTIENPRYVVFDMLSFNEFVSGTSNRTFSERYEQIHKTFKDEKINCKEISIVPQIDYNQQNFDNMMEEAKDNGWEGLILRKDDIYKGKRSSDILKVKEMEREEYTVVDIATGPFKVISKDTGLQEEIETVTAVTILHKNYPVSVGSGFSIDERKDFYKNPHKILGKVISVQFFEETTNKDGTPSLRFPTFKGLYGKTRKF